MRLVLDRPRVPRRAAPVCGRRSSCCGPTPIRVVTADEPRATRPSIRSCPTFFLKGRAPTWSDLTGTWATSTTYAPKIFEVYFRILAWVTDHPDPRATGSRRARVVEPRPGDRHLADAGADQSHTPSGNTVRSRVQLLRR